MGTSEKIARRINELEAYALGALKTGRPEAAADYIRKALLWEPNKRLSKALGHIHHNRARHAICVLDGHNYVGGASCFHCGDAIVTHSVRG